MFRIYLVFFVFLISCSQKQPQVDVVYPTISQEQKNKVEIQNHQENNIKVENTKSREDIVDLSEGSDVVLYQKPISLEEKNRSLNWKLYQAEEELKTLKSTIAKQDNGDSNVNSLSNKEKNTLITKEKDTVITRENNTIFTDVTSSHKTIENHAVEENITEKTVNQSSENNTPIALKIKTETEIEVKEEEKVLRQKNAESKQTTEQKKYNLRIISLPKHDIYEKSVENIVLFLKTENIVAEYRALGNYWVVDITDVPAYRSQEATDFQEKVKQIKYQGSFQFKDAYYTAQK